MMEQTLMRETVIRGGASRILENMVGPDAGMLAYFLCTNCYLGLDSACKYLVFVQQGGPGHSAPCSPFPISLEHPL